MGRVLIIARACAEEHDDAHVELRIQHEHYPTPQEMVGIREAAAGAYTHGTGRVACRVAVVVLPWVDDLDESPDVPRVAAMPKLATYRCGNCGHTEDLDQRDWQESLPRCPTFTEIPPFETCPGSMRPVKEAEAA